MYFTDLYDLFGSASGDLSWLSHAASLTRVPIIPFAAALSHNLSPRVWGTLVHRNDRLPRRGTTCPRPTESTVAPARHIIGTGAVAR